MKTRICLAAAILISAQFSADFASANDKIDIKYQSVKQISPTILSQSDKAQFANIFAAIHSENWAEASRLIAQSPKGPMANMALAELYLAANSPKVEAIQLEALLHSAPYLPQAERLEKLAIKRGATGTPDRPEQQRLSYQGAAPRRDLPDNISDSSAAAVRDAIQAAIKIDNPAQAESALVTAQDSLSSAALSEMRYRVAWGYYIENDDKNARRVGAQSQSGVGEWAVQGAWVAGLSSWRIKDYGAAFSAFDQVAQEADNDELKSAGLFWSSRAAMASRQPQKIQKRLQVAAQYPETFYGLLASETLGMESIARKQSEKQNDWAQLKDQKNVQIAIGLSQIGENQLADQALRFQARIGDSDQYAALSQLAGALNLPSTQLWMGHYGPSDQQSDAMARYPLPNWTPTGGWRVEPALVMAHSLQESAFRTDVISPAGARGLMQVRPGTAQDMARKRGINFAASDLDKPAINLEYGQTYLEKLRDMDATGGLLPKVIAAYNAGPNPIARWNDEIHDGGDPLLYVESIPYWETRGYVSTILRNYWIYEMRTGKNGTSMAGLAQHLWPSFPTANGSITLQRENMPAGGIIAARR